ncbi:MAG: hypothetical protein CL933_20675 [Deltaproteobacteria bacterium]|nr:hypothetical protein [Deltaproteobacteria bacterium]
MFVVAIMRAVIVGEMKPVRRETSIYKRFATATDRRAIWNPSAPPRRNRSAPHRSPPPRGPSKEIDGLDIDAPRLPATGAVPANP